MFAVGSLNILDMDMCVADMVNYISFTYVLLSFVNCHNKTISKAPFLSSSRI